MMAYNTMRDKNPCPHCDVCRGPHMPGLHRTPSTTETATGDGFASRWVARSEIDAERRRMAIDAVLPVSGPKRTAIEAAADGVMVTREDVKFDPYPLHLLRSEISAIYDAFREAAAPATPEGPDA